MLLLTEARKAEKGQDGLGTFSLVFRQMVHLQFLCYCDFSKRASLVSLTINIIMLVVPLNPVSSPQAIND